MRGKFVRQHLALLVAPICRACRFEETFDHVGPDAGLSSSVARKNRPALIIFCQANRVNRVEFFLRFGVGQGRKRLEHDAHEGSTWQDIGPEDNGGEGREGRGLIQRLAREGQSNRDTQALRNEERQVNQAKQAEVETAQRKEQSEAEQIVATNSVMDDYTYIAQDSENGHFVDSDGKIVEPERIVDALREQDAQPYTSADVERGADVSKREWKYENYSMNDLTVHLTGEVDERGDAVVDHFTDKDGVTVRGDDLVRIQANDEARGIETAFSDAEMWLTITNAVRRWPKKKPLTQTRWTWIFQNKTN